MNNKNELPSGMTVAAETSRAKTGFALMSDDPAQPSGS